MGQKKKIGKSRQDKFYKLAKESGFRARSAFKLIQLNRKFEFLQSSKVVIDLCAAPGGWLQVASQNTPVSSVIIGVDLMPIKPIPRVTSIVGDITTDKCRKDLKKELQTWKADCVLNDGAPNVGQNWVHDAFQQNQLTLQAIKLATEFLRKGGWFVTKVFRSKDYNALLWVLHQLFKKVHATKPQASRNESAEIFVVCQHYLAPDRIDPKYLDPKAVFKEVEQEPKLKINLVHPEKHSRHREGYPTGDLTLYHTLNVSDFIGKENYLELLSHASAVVFDDIDVENHPLTTHEIKECLKDIKVLGRKDIRNLIAWRKKLKKHMTEESDKNDEESGNLEEDKENSENELEKLEEQIAELQGEEKKALKRKVKKTRREKAKLQHKMDLKMVIGSDQLELNDDVNLFDLNKIKSKKQLNRVEVIEDYGNDIDEDQEGDAAKLPKVRFYDKNSKDHLFDTEESNQSASEASGENEHDDFAPDDDDIEWESDDNTSDKDCGDDDDNEDGINPLLVGQPGKDFKTDMWFSKESFAGLEDDMDEEIELENMVQAYQKKGGIIKDTDESKFRTEKFTKKEENSESREKRRTGEEKQTDSDENEEEMSVDNSDNYSDSDSYSESEEEEGEDPDTTEFYKQQKESLKNKKNNKDNSQDSFEIVPTVEPVKLSAKALAVGAAIVSSRKRRREVIDSGYNRYMMFGEENLPDWFQKDEIRHQRVQLPVSKGEIEEYKMKMKVIDANPIKKVAEAKARKKRKTMKKLEKARKKADAINENLEVTDREKWQQIKQVYKKAGLLSAKKKDVKYVVCKKSQSGKRIMRPSGVTGPYRVVDGRMKKDKRGMARLKSKKSKKGRKQNK